jgi:hypothetical protein
VEQPQVLDDNKLEEVLNKPAVKKITRSGKIYRRPMSRLDTTSSARKVLQKALADVRNRVAAKPCPTAEECTCWEKLDALAMRILHRSALELNQNLVVTFLKKAQEMEGLQMCTKHLQLIRGAMKLKTNMPLDILQAHVKRCIKLGENYTTLCKTTESYSWFVGAKALKNIKIGTSEKEEVFHIPATQSVSFNPSTIIRERICKLLSDLDKTSLENFNATGIICISRVFQHWKWHKDAEGEKSLKDIAAKEAAVYNFHAPLDRG